jgi:hypothetical protein
MKKFLNFGVDLQSEYCSDKKGILNVSFSFQTSIREREKAE